MRVAALYDIHGNLPALEAVLAEVRGADIDGIVVGGDVVPGPMPRETLRCLLELDLPVQFIHGNCERAVLAQIAARDGSPVTYWGTTSGRPLAEPNLENMRWSAEQVLEYERVLATWPATIRVPVEGLGEVLFCHGTPRSETEIFTRRTAEERLVPLFDGLGLPVVVCGHTHMPFDRTIGTTRVVNAGSVGDPFGQPGAFWAVLGPGIELRCTLYDFAAAADRIRATPYPQASEFAERSVLHPPAEEAMLELFGKAEVDGRTARGS